VIPDFLQVGGKRPTNPRVLLAELVKAYPNEPLKQRRLFHAIVVEDGALMRACHRACVQ